MFKIPKIVIALTLAFLMASSAPLRAAALVKVPIQTAVQLSLVDTISSKTAQIGDRVNLRVSSDVVINGKTVIKAGAPAQGEVVTAQSAGKVGAAGQLVINILNVQAVDGSTVALNASKTSKGEEKTTQSIIFTVLCCILALLMKGKEAEFAAGMSFTAYTVAPVDVSVN